MVRFGGACLQHQQTRIARYVSITIVFGRTPSIHLELELGLTLFEPITQTEYADTVRGVLKDIRQITDDHLTKARARSTVR